MPVFAGKLEISEQAAYAIFKKDSIQTDLLLKIAELLNAPVWDLLDLPNPTYTLTENQPPTTVHEPNPNYCSPGEAAALRELVRTQRDLIEQLKTAGGAAQLPKNPTPAAELTTNKD